MVISIPVRTLGDPSSVHSPDENPVAALYVIRPRR